MKNRNVAHFLTNGNEAIQIAERVLAQCGNVDDTTHVLFDCDAVFDIYGYEIDECEDDTIGEAEQTAIDYVELEIWIIAATNLKMDSVVEVLCDIQAHGL